METVEQIKCQMARVETIIQMQELTLAQTQRITAMTLLQTDTVARIDSRTALAILPQEPILE
jgi:hypothetical protein